MFLGLYESAEKVTVPMLYALLGFIRSTTVLKPLEVVALQLGALPWYLWLNLFPFRSSMNPFFCRMCIL